MNVPWLARMQLRVKGEAIVRWLEDLAGSAQWGSAPTRKHTRFTPEQARALFEAALNMNDDRLDGYAAGAGAETHAFRALFALLPIPFLHACARRMSPAMRWSEGYCPLCGAWPAFAENRGIERSRHLRCGRCGSGWRAPGLRCVYCGLTRHDSLGALVAQQNESQAKVEVCNQCHGYLKAFVVLEGCAPAQVMLDDLDSVALDIVAATRGYRRPTGLGYRLDVMLAVTGARSGNE